MVADPLFCPRYLMSRPVTAALLVGCSLALSSCGAMNGIHFGGHGDTSRNPEPAPPTPAPPPPTPEAQAEPAPDAAAKPKRDWLHFGGLPHFGGGAKPASDTRPAYIAPAP